MGSWTGRLALARHKMTWYGMVRYGMVQISMAQVAQPGLCDLQTEEKALDARK